MSLPIVHKQTNKPRRHEKLCGRCHGESARQLNAAHTAWQKDMLRQEPNAPPSRLYTDKQEGHRNARLLWRLKYCCSCCRRPSECEDPAKMTHSRMAFASRDLCCSVRKVSSDQLCLLASADSEGERGRAGVASVSECARASQRRCVLFYQS